MLHILSIRKILTLTLTLKFKRCWSCSIYIFCNILHKMNGSTSNIETEWNPWPTLNLKELVSNETVDNNLPYAVIVLNRPIELPPDALVPLWLKASLRVTVDGGTDQWFQWLKANQKDSQNIPLPDLITGDMDSVDKCLLHFLRKKGVTVIKTEDQNETDFTKCIREIKKQPHFQIQQLYVIAKSSGRFDQIMANINTLFKIKHIMTNAQTFLVSTDSLTWLLNAGCNRIHIPRILIENQIWCSLIPIGRPVKATTRGLKWNLDNTELEFGNLVSSSNTYELPSSCRNYVIVNCDKDIVWSMGLK